MVGRPRIDVSRHVTRPQHAANFILNEGSLLQCKPTSTMPVKVTKAEVLFSKIIAEHSHQHAPADIPYSEITKKSEPGRANLTYAQAFDILSAFIH